MKLLSFVLLQFLFSLAIAQPAERWVEVQYMQRMKDHLMVNTPPELIKIKQFTPGVLIAGKYVSIYEDTGSTSGSAIKPPDQNTQKEPLNKEDGQRSALPRTLVYNKVLRKIFKSFDTNIMVVVHKTPNAPFRIEEQISDKNWTILNEVAVIEGMNCRKAFYVTKKGITIEAWFTDAIPISNGPAEYHGLPGLILKIESPYLTIEANKISFIREQIIKQPTEGELIKAEELLQRMMGTKPSIDEESLKKEIMKTIPNSSSKN
ncbi:GLPGLI family protein [Rhodoflexus caldus]|uniref:GLPGLI family protein n=1 Tax=Rhodoflexus caldus TaxID=2891236 RepID=UPI002029F2CE|nr:GLPGLI family protein [Rhodoflexus caldus]